MRLDWLWLSAAYLAASGTAAWLGLRSTRNGQHWLQHMEDLRRRLLTAGAVVLTVAMLLFSFELRDGRIRPSLHDSLASHVFAAIKDDLVPAGVQLVVVRPIDGFLAQMVLAIGMAAIVAAPVWVSQITGFFLPALKPAERQALRNAAIPVAGLFLMGAAFAYLYVIPFLLKTLYGYGTALGAQPLLQVSEFISFTVGLMLVMGAAFQTPVVMYVLTRVGLVQATTWRRGWRHAVVAILIVSALVTDPTVVSQVLVAAPLMGLYVLGIIAAGFSRPSR